jgi:hypothetical protein
MDRGASGCAKRRASLIVKVGVVGLGHVGLVTAACFAHVGHEVIGVDVQAERVEGLRRGITPFYEPALPELVRDGLDAGRLTFDQAIEAVGRGARCHLHLRGDAVAAQRQSRPDSDRKAGSGPRATPRQLSGARREEHGAGQDRRAPVQDDASSRSAGFRRRLESRILT